MTKKPLILISIALLGGGPVYCQENGIPKDGPLEGHAVINATSEQEAEIRRLIEDFVITEKEAQANAAERIRYDKAKNEAEKGEKPNHDPFANDTPPEILKELEGYSKTREDAFNRLTSFKDLAFLALAAHLDDHRPSLKWWNHSYAKTVGAMCYRVIHDQLTEFPDGYSEYGYQRTGRDGQSHVKPYWAGTPYDEDAGYKSEGLAKWLQENQHLTYPEKRIKCLSWMLAEEKKIGAIDPQGYYVNILPLEREILELKAKAGKDVANELARVRKLSKTKPGDQVPKELLPDGPLPEIEKKHSLQETSAMLGSCPDGHTTLKDIPILYGSFLIQTKNPADWNDEDKALAARRDAKEVILGGEVNSAFDPRFQPSCLTCGYRYKTDSVPDIGSNWIKTGHQFTDFFIPFSQVARSLPIAGMANADFSVEVNKKKVVVSETIEITIPANKKDELVAKIEKWIDENQFNRSLLHIDTPPFPRLYEQSVENGNAWFYIEVLTDSEKETTCIRFYLWRSDK